MPTFRGANAAASRARPGLASPQFSRSATENATLQISLFSTSKRWLWVNFTDLGLRRGLRTGREDCGVVDALGEANEAGIYWKTDGLQNYVAGGLSTGRDRSGRDGVTALERVFRAIRTVLLPRKECSQLELFQTKPEYKRKEGAYRNMSKTPCWLATAGWFLLQRCSNRSPIPSRERARLRQGHAPGW